MANAWRRGVRAVGLAGAAGAVAAGLWAVGDYRRWRALGPGGLPATWRGWLTTTRLRLRTRDPLALEPLLARLGEAGDHLRLADLPPRAGERPRIAPHPVPHRQLDQRAGEAALAALRAVFERAVSSDTERLVFAQSWFEKRNRAVTARMCGCADAHASHGEIAHIHPADGSMHMILGPSDALAVIRAGWGERHGLAGIALGLPLTYTLIYAPRDERDVAAIERILAAAIAHMTRVTG